MVLTEAPSRLQRTAPQPPPAGPVAVTRSRGDAIAVVLLMTLAAVLRLPTLTRAYWVDEGISIGIASHRLAQIPGLLRHDGSPPLFYAILHFWIRVFGASEVSTHSLSLLTSLLIVPVAWWCGRALFGTYAARAAALLAATNPFLNWYATETRMYPLVVALAMAAVTLTVRATQRRSGRDAAGAVLVFSALLYTHNWAIYVIAATAATCATRALRQRDWRQVAAVVAGAGAVALSYLPWLPSFLQQAAHTAAPWAVSPSVGDLISDPASILGGTLGAVVVPVFIIGVVATRHRRAPAENTTVALLALIGMLTMLGGWLGAQAEPSWTSRYLAVALGPLLLAVAGALGVTRLGRWILGGAAVLLVLWSVIGSLLPDPNAHYAKSNVGAIAAAARPSLGPGDIVIVTQTEQLAVLAHYLPIGVQFVTATGPVADPRVVDWRDLIDRLGHADPCRAIAPQIDALRPGGHVLVVNPLRRVGSSGTTWSRTVSTEVAAINRMVLGDRGLAPVASFTAGSKPKPFSAVTARLFTKGSDRAPCP